MKRYILPLLLVISIGVGIAAVKYVRAILIGKQSDGTYLVSTGQIVSPVGHIKLTEYARPKDLALSPDKTHVAVLSTNKLLIYGRNGDLVKSFKIGAAALGIC